MLRSLVGSEMCIRDRYQRRVRGFFCCRLLQAKSCWFGQPQGTLVATAMPVSESEAKDWCTVFGIPANSVLIQDFACSLWHKFHLPGRMFVWQHHLAFMHRMPPMNELVVVVPLDDVTSIAKAKSMKILSNAIEIEHKNKGPVGEPGPTKLFFSNFMKRDETYNVVHRTWKLTTTGANRMEIAVPPPPPLPEHPGAAAAADGAHPIPGAEAEEVTDGTISPPSSSPPILTALPSHKRTDSLGSNKSTHDFGIPDDEQLVSEIECKVDVSEHESDEDHDKLPGSVYMFKNYICFKAAEENGARLRKSESSRQWTLPLRSILTIDKASTNLVLGNAIIMTTAHQKIHLSGIKHRDQVLATLSSLWEISRALVDISGPCPDPVTVSSDPESSPRKRAQTLDPSALGQSLERQLPSTLPAAEGSQLSPTSSPADSPALNPQPSPAGKPADAAPRTPRFELSALGPWMPTICATVLALVSLWLICLLCRLDNFTQLSDSRCSVGSTEFFDTADDDLKTELNALKAQVQSVLDRLPPGT
eukprot:TRINITY_DN2578_c0_g1_i1.p1 TRINITY_DN2578_c0_g1~~TRINITY_DN2578_c0_g1_i1.p1  ORF type:complete len:548 (+),score=148.40 TRINITY_DN2578_c0_g1_i1:46-1644(+)